MQNPKIVVILSLTRSLEFSSRSLASRFRENDSAPTIISKTESNKKAQIKLELITKTELKNIPTIKKIQK